MLTVTGCSDVSVAGGTDDILSVQDDGSETVQDDGSEIVQDDGSEIVQDDGPPPSGCTSDEDCTGELGELDTCQVASCNTDTGVCEAVAGNDGSTCDDGNACTEETTCNEGACNGGTEVVCSGEADLSQCKLGQTCDPTDGCVPHFDKPCQDAKELGLLPVGSGSNFEQAVVATDTDTYADAYFKWKDLNYYLTNVTSYYSSELGASFYSGIWRKRTDGVLDTKGWRNMSEETYLEKLDENPASEGWRVLDLHGKDTTPSTYSMAMIQESSESFLSWYVYRFGATNFEKILNKNSAFLAEKNLTNKYPINVGTYFTDSGVKGYTTVWEENVDGLDWQIVNVSPSEWSDGNENGIFWDYWLNGYRVRSLSYHCDTGVGCGGCCLRYVAAFTSDKDSFYGAASYRVNGNDAIQEKQLDLKEKNYELVDLDQIYNSSDHKFAGQWVRRFRKNFLGTNLVASGDKFDELNDLLSGYDGNVGFYIEDISTGNHIYYNRHEHFYLASMSKVWIATKILAMVDAGSLSLDDEFIFFNEDYLEEDNTADILDISKIGQSFTLEEYIGWMINFSSTNATDKLFGLIGNEAMNDYLVNDLGIRSIGEVTSICDLDKRIVSQAVSCATALPCNVFERWYREGEQVASGALDEYCVGLLESGWNGLTSSEKHEYYRTYYHTLANSISPAQMAQFYRRLLTFELLQPETRNKLIDIMDATAAGSYNDNIANLGLYNKLACKGGSKHRSRSWTAITWFKDDTEQLSNATFNYNINVFVEQYPGGQDSDYDDARDLARDIIGLAVGILSENQ